MVHQTRLDNPTVLLSILYKGYDNKEDSYLQIDLVSGNFSLVLQPIPENNPVLALLDYLYYGSG